MTIALELHDTWLEELVWKRDGAGSLLLWAFVNYAEGELFKSPGKSGYQHVRLHFTGMTLEGKFNSEDPYISDGELWENGAAQPDSGLIQLPIERRGAFCLEMTVATLFEAFKIHSDSIQSEVLGELYPCE